MNVRYGDLCSLDFSFQNISSYRTNAHDHTVYDCEDNGRTKHLIYHQISGCRHYCLGEHHLLTLQAGEVLFLPHGVRYRSFIDDDAAAEGIGISFNMVTGIGEPIYMSEGIRLLTVDNPHRLLKRFERILYSVHNPNENVLRLKGELYSLLDTLFAQSKQRTEFKSTFGDILQVVQLLENHPEQNLSVKEMADMCLMSESSFLRKFKEYSGGVSPVKYKNRIRLLLAEEFADSALTLGEIAELLGFYDAAHLCKLYKQEKGYTLKKQENIR